MYKKILEMFLLRLLFNKNEYDFKSKEFNPFKIFIIIMLYINVIFTIILMVKISNLYETIEKDCPNIIKEKNK